MKQRDQIISLLKSQRDHWFTPQEIIDVCAPSNGSGMPQSIRVHLNLMQGKDIDKVFGRVAGSRRLHVWYRWPEYSEAMISPATREFLEEEDL